METLPELRLYKQRETAAQTQDAAKELAHTVRACRQDVLREVKHSHVFTARTAVKSHLLPVTAALRPAWLLGHRAANRSVHNVPCYSWCGDASKQLLILLHRHEPSMFKALTRLKCNVCPQRSHSDSVSQCLTSLWSHFRRFMIKVMFSYQG